MTALLLGGTALQHAAGMDAPRVGDHVAATELLCAAGARPDAGMASEPAESLEAHLDALPHQR